MQAGVARHLGPSAIACPAHPRGQRPAMVRWEVQGDPCAVEIDACPSCAGIWFDAGEEAKILAAATAVDGARMAVAKAQAASGELTDAERDRFVAELREGDPLVRDALRRGTVRTPYLSAGLVWLNVAAFGLSLGALAADMGLRRAIGSVALVPAEIVAGRGLYRIVTHAFFHAGPQHLVINLLYLWTFARALEIHIGHKRFALLYGAGLLGAAALHVAVDPTSTIPSIGASGAIAALLGAFLVLMPDTQTLGKRIDARSGAVVAAILYLAQQIIPALLHRGGIAWYAHIGGFVTGTLLALILRAKRRKGAGDD